MKTNSIKSDFIRYVSQNILGEMAYSCYTLADTFFIAASLGANGLAALNLAFPVFCLLNGIGLMIGMGGGVRYSIAKGRRDIDTANKIFTNTFYLTLLFSTILQQQDYFLQKSLPLHLAVIKIYLL